MNTSSAAGESQAVHEGTRGVGEDSSGAEEGARRVGGSPVKDGEMHVARVRG